MSGFHPVPGLAWPGLAASLTGALLLILSVIENTRQSGLIEINRQMANSKRQAAATTITITSFT